MQFQKPFPKVCSLRRHYDTLPSLKPDSLSSSAARLGDTKELEDFIADLDRTLESEC